MDTHTYWGFDLAESTSVFPRTRKPHPFPSEQQRETAVLVYMQKFAKHWRREVLILIHDFAGYMKSACASFATCNRARSWYQGAQR